ncbi:MAG: Sir2 family NAD-dependent protein deacetylase [Archangium sp.]
MDSNVIESVAKARRVVFLCGAGLSVPSGIRAYRSGPNAIWGEHVLEWGTREKFLAGPAEWWSKFWLEAHGDLFKKFEPNAAHHALAKFMTRNEKHLVITQNIDGLHRLAGHPEAQLIEIHGRHDRFICSAGDGCEGIDHPVASVDLSRVADGVIPKCAHCDAPMRPNVLLFDEHYDSHETFQAWRGKKALNDADVLIFVGTSFSVGITSYAVRCADVSGAMVINVNVERSPFPQFHELIGGAEKILPELLGVSLS